LSRPNKAGAEQQIALRSLIGDVKHTIAELAAAEGRLLSIGELFGRAWQLGRLLAARKEPVDHGKWMIRYRRIFASSAKRIPPIDALDSKSRNDRFYFINRDQTPFTVFRGKLDVFSSFETIREGWCCEARK